MTPRRTLVTAALPYANGPLHLGHLLEYTLADIYVRGMKASGRQALLICANDDHGTPIELNAKKLNMTPEAMTQHFRRLQLHEFAQFGIEFDHFGSTNSTANREVVESAFATLKQQGLIAERNQVGNFCPKDQRFLPDRFIRGQCPRCDSPDQYGDVCERCGATYSPVDLKQPRCALCGTQPEPRDSEHLFFVLSRPEDASFLRQWIDSGTLQPDVANYVRSWIDQGLRDWNISRDGPYFGFSIPGHPQKFFYVWLDAPFGYVAASKEWADKNGVHIDTLWRSEETAIEHIIGKDIMYFHTLFWPAVLKGVGYTLPSKVHVHGMLTVDGEKMSKSRGTFINAEVFRSHVEPQALRYYLATKYTPESRDVDLSLDDFVLRVNGDLVNKMANLISRVGQFVSTRLENRLGPLSIDRTSIPWQQLADQALLPEEPTPLDPATTAWQLLAERVIVHSFRIQQAYARRDIAQVTRDLCRIADIGNELMQSHKPWDTIKQDKEQTRHLCTFIVNVCQALLMGLGPIVPKLAEKAAEGFDCSWSKIAPTELFGLENRTLGTYARLMDRVERKQLDAMVAASKDGQSPSTSSTDPEASTPGEPLINIDDFAKVCLKVGIVKSAEPVAKSKKLLKLMVDVGESEPRQILSGIAQHVSAQSLIGRRVTVVANLKPAKLMGLTSHGMILASEDEKAGLDLLEPAERQPPGSRVR